MGLIEYKHLDYVGALNVLTLLLHFGTTFTLRAKAYLVNECSKYAGMYAFIIIKTLVPY